VIGIGASFLVVEPNTSQNLTALGIDFIALLGKYQNTLVDSGIVSVLIPFETEYILVSHKVLFVSVCPHISFVELLLANYDITDLDSLPVVL